MVVGKGKAEKVKEAQHQKNISYSLQEVITWYRTHRNVSAMLKSFKRQNWNSGGYICWRDGPLITENTVNSLIKLP